MTANIPAVEAQRQRPERIPAQPSSTPATKPPSQLLKFTKDIATLPEKKLIKLPNFVDLAKSGSDRHEFLVVDKNKSELL